MKKIETITIDSGQSLTLSVQMILMLMLGSAILASIFGDYQIDYSVFGLVIYFSTLIIHEMLHGVGFWVCGVTPKFGLSIAGFLPIAYATAKDKNSKLNIKGMLLTAYLPFVVISIVCIALGYIFPNYLPLIAVAFLGNFSGAIGDIWIASKLWKYISYNKDVLVQDTKSGLIVYSDLPAAITLGEKASIKKTRQNNSFGKICIISIFIFGFIMSIVPAIMLQLGFTGDYTLGYNDLFSIFSVHSAAKVTTISFNMFTPILLGLATAVFYSLIRSAKNSPKLRHTRTQ